MAKGTFFSVGVGPGDPLLMTYKAGATIAKSDVIFAPKSGGKENIALKIAEEHVKNKQILECDMPMTKDPAILKASHQKAIGQIQALLEQGKTVAFLTLGDPSIYSTAMYVHQGLTDLGYTTVLIPGVPSFCGVAAGLNTCLCEGDQQLHIIPASYSDTDKALALPGNKIFMKAGSAMGELKNRLLEEPNQRAMLVECATMPTERVCYNLKELEVAPGYFCVVLVKEQ